MHVNLRTKMAKINLVGLKSHLTKLKESNLYFYLKIIFENKRTVFSISIFFFKKKGGIVNVSCVLAMNIYIF